MYLLKTVTLKHNYSTTAQLKKKKLPQSRELWHFYTFLPHAGEAEQVDRRVHNHAGGRAAAMARVRAVLR